LYGREDREEERLCRRDERNGNEDGEGQRKRRTVWHKTQVRILFSGWEREDGTPLGKI